MCSSSRPKTPPRLPEAPLLPTQGTGVTGTDKDKRRKAAASSTILTSGQGVTGEASTAQKTLLGA